ncbi:MAG: hypothetical protein GYB67_12800 [Chloroflexi bacterium]|nr:hypothetical protein [Chloroflexota bacterium]
MAAPPILYLGGSPCAGKSSVAEVLAADHGLHYLRLDDRLFAHVQAATADTYPVLASIGAATCDQIWLILPLAQARRTIHAYIEEFSLHQVDIARMRKPLLVEGAGLLPCLIAPLLQSSQQALYMVPTPIFQRHHYGLRPWVGAVVRECSDPDQAYANWMRRDEIFARWIQRNALTHGFKTIIVDGTQSIEANARIAAIHFGLA